MRTHHRHGYGTVRRSPHLAEALRAHREWLKMRREMKEQGYDVPEDDHAHD